MDQDKGEEIMGCDSQFDNTTRTLVKDAGPRVDTFRIPPMGFAGTVAPTPGGEELLAKGLSGTGSSTFYDELTALLNRKCQENESNTPDFILADYLLRSLAALNNAVKAREDWYGVQFEPGSKKITMRQPRRG